MSIPGFTGATGGETRDSEAAVDQETRQLDTTSRQTSLKSEYYPPMPFVEGVADGETLGAWVATGVSSLPTPPFESPLIVEVEGDRPKPWVRGARCVSFSSEVR